MKFKVFLLFLLAPLLAMPAYAAKENGGSDLEEVRYLDINPAIVTNYGGPGRMSYVKAVVSLEVGSQEEFQTVFYHFPSIRHALVMLLGRQTDATIAAGEARDALRAEALAEMKAIMVAEEGEAIIDDLLFSSFFVQR